ncbi:MAG: sugar ABC transporter permease [Firmicutes bacterium]|nr:sugar ABC transporter permease [Bacillota bacterium]
MANKMSDLEYLKLNKFQRMLHNLVSFILSIPSRLVKLGKTIWGAIKAFCLAVANEAKDILLTFVHGDWKTKLSFLVMGFGNLARGQILRGLLFLLFEVVFIVYMVLYGGYWIGKLSLTGLTATTTQMVTVETGTNIPGMSSTTTVEQTVYGDNTLQILIYGTLSLAFVLCFLYTWRVNVKQAKLAQEYKQYGRRLKKGSEDMKDLLDRQFYKTVLALPVLGITLFTVMPIVMMIMVAFTNYDYNHTPPQNLFAWVGLDNFNQLFTWGNGSSTFSATFGELLCWTLIWAFFATFTNYFLGMLIAMMINKKGIKFKKMWRGILVLTIAIPQFISLLYVSKMFADNGLINQFLQNHGIIDLLHQWGWLSESYTAIPFWTDPTLAKIMVILINIWIGVPYLMLITTGVLMNIPADLYESARIDGANAFQQYYKITLPYMLFVTGPYLLTSFTGNMNNFNVIYLLTGGAPYTLSNSAGKTDLLITWLYRLTVTNNDYKTAAVIGIMVFVVVACISLVVYNLMPSMKNEEDFQ